jgi:hypothetical protein
VRDRPLRDRRRPCCLEGSGVIGDPPGSALIGKTDVLKRLQGLDHALGALGSSRRQPAADCPSERAVGPLIWLLTADAKRIHHAFNRASGSPHSPWCGGRRAPAQTDLLGARLDRFDGDMPELVRPTLEVHRSFLAAMAEFRGEGPRWCGRQLHDRIGEP